MSEAYNEFDEVEEAVAVAQVPEPQNGNIPLPNWDSTTSIADTLTVVNTHVANDEFGYSVLAERLNSYMKHMDIAARLREKATASIQRLNGQRSDAEKQGDAVKSLSRAARKTYGMFSSEQLRAQCKVLGIDARYIGDSDLLDAVVDKTLAMGVAAE